MKEQLSYLFTAYFKDTTGICKNEAILSQKLFDSFTSLFWGFVISTIIMGVIYPSFNIVMIICLIYYISEVICMGLFIYSNRVLLTTVRKTNLLVRALLFGSVAFIISPIPLLLFLIAPKWLLIIITLVGLVPFSYSMYLLWEWLQGKNEVSEVDLQIPLPDEELPKTSNAENNDEKKLDNNQ